jgi:PAS domain S-box-containing protein
VELLGLSQLIDALPALVWIASADNGAEFLNRRWCEYTGLSLDQLIGDGWQSAIHPNDLALVRERWRGFLESGRPGEIEARLRRHDGRYRWFHLSASPWRTTPVHRQVVRDHYGCRASSRPRRAQTELIIDTTPALIWSAGPDGSRIR